MFVNGPHASMLAGAYAVCTSAVIDALHALGGLQVLFPLFCQHPDGPFVHALLGLLAGLVAEVPAMQHQMDRIRGFVLLGALLEPVRFQFSIADC